jgi:hypothetical protein
MSYQAITLSAARLRLQQRYEGKPFWDNEQARLAINEALRFYNLLTGRWHGRESITTVTTLAYLYSTSASMLYRMRMTFNGYPVHSTSREGLNDLRRSWRAESTTTGGEVPTRPLFWAPVSLRSFYLWPTDAAGSNTLLIDGVATTPVLVDDADYVDLGDDDLTILLGYALHVLTFSKGGAVFANTLPLYRAFLAAAAEENGVIKTSMTYRRAMGLDHRGLKPLRGVPTRIDDFVQGASR